MWGAEVEHPAIVVDVRCRRAGLHTHPTHRIVYRAGVVGHLFLLLAVHLLLVTPDLDHEIRDIGGDLAGQDRCGEPAQPVGVGDHRQ